MNYSFPAEKKLIFSFMHTFDEPIIDTLEFKFHLLNISFFFLTTYVSSQLYKPWEISFFPRKKIIIPTVHMMEINIKKNVSAKFGKNFFVYLTYLYFY